jgi:hypothetical protein
MTKVRFHGPIAGFSGAMGEMVFADNKEKNRTVAYMKPNHPLSEAQLNHRERFSEAAAYAKSALADPVRRELYLTVAQERDIPAFSLAVGDYLNVPTIKPLDLSEYKGRVGDPILIRAVDDIGFADLEVELTAIDGTHIEKGKAVETGVRSGHWVYTATAPVALGADIFIKVSGMDHARNETQITENIFVGVEN